MCGGMPAGTTTGQVSCSAFREQHRTHALLLVPASLAGQCPALGRAPVLTATPSCTAMQCRLPAFYRGSQASWAFTLGRPLQEACAHARCAAGCAGRQLTTIAVVAMLVVSRAVSTPWGGGSLPMALLITCSTHQQTAHRHVKASPGTLHRHMQCAAVPQQASQCWRAP